MNENSEIAISVDEVNWHPEGNQEQTLDEPSTTRRLGIEEKCENLKKFGLKYKKYLHKL